MKRYIIRVRQTRRKNWLLVEDFVTASNRAVANALAAARYPRYWVKTQEVARVEDLEQLETLGELSIATPEDVADRTRAYKFTAPVDPLFEDIEQYIM